MKKNKSLSFKFMTFSVISITVIMTLLGMFQNTTRKSELTQRLDSSLKAANLRLSQTLPSAIWAFDENSAKNIIIAELGEPSILGASIRLMEQKENVFAGLIKKEAEFVDFNPLQTALRKDEFDIETPLVKDEETIGTLTLRYTTAYIAKELTASAVSSIIQIILIDLILLFGVYVLISGIIINPMKKGIDFAVLISEGNLTAKLDILQNDEIGQLAAALKDMLEKLTKIVNEINSASRQVSAGSQQLSSTAQQMSQGATEQASSVEEISSSMEEMTSNIKQNADNALQTEKIALKSSLAAEEGGRSVAATVNAMKEIAAKIGIIEEIARSTNMLALNASIEAARAGEYGKGFAVVASEVGKLAERSQKEAGEIRSLSIESVTIAEQAGATISALIPDIRRTAELVQEISAASNEQNTGAEQINMAIMQLDKVVQQNAAVSEEAASMSEELAGQAVHMQGTMEFFTVGEAVSAQKREAATSRGRTKTDAGDFSRAKPNFPSRQIPSGKSESVNPSRGMTKDNERKPAVKGILLNLDDDNEKTAGRDALDNEFQEF
jgi:methyl-accepting chemotaxis protein